MDDKLKQLYELYSRNGLIKTTDYNTFSSANENQRKQLYDLGKKNGLFKSTDYNTFSTAFAPVKKKGSTGLPSQPQGKGTTSATVKTTTLKPSVSFGGKKVDYEIQMFTGFPGKEGKQYALDKSSAIPVWREKSNVGYDKAITDPARVDALNKHFKQKASSSEMEQVFTGFPEKEFNEYRVRDGKWERRSKGTTSWQTVINEGSILGLNKQFKQNVEVTKDIEKAKIDQKKEIENKKNLNKLLSSVNSNLVGSSEEYASGELEKKFPGFKFIQQGFNTDNLLVIAPNKNRVNISLDNFTDKDDRSQATVLREFIRNNSDEEMASAERELSFAEREKERFLERSEKEMFENDIPSEFKFVNGKLVISTYVDKQKNTKQYGAIEDKLKENRKKYIDKKEEQFDDIYYRFKNQPYNSDKMSAAYASVRKDDAEIKRVNDYINDVRNTSKDIASEKSKIEEQMNDLVVKLRSGEITREQYNAEYKPAIEEKLLDLKNRGNQLANEIGNINVVNKAVDESIAKNFIIDESKGSFGGGMASKFVKGLTYIPRIAAAGSMSKKEQNDLVDLITGKGTTQEYTESSDRSDLVKSLFSLSESMGALTAGAALGGGAATYASFYAQSYYEMKDELDEVKGMTNAEKVLMSSLYGSLSSVLEKFGVDMITQKTPIGRNLKNNILTRMFSDLPKGASKEFIDAAMLNSVKMTLANAGLNAVGGAVGEGVTESLQSLSSVGIKQVYDELNDTEYFNNKSGWEILSDVMYEGYLGALGGGVMSTVASSASVVKNGLLNAVNKEQAELLVNAAKTEGVDQALITNLKASILKGNITKEEAKVIADSFNEIKGKIQSMPDNLSISDKSVALDLMVEKDKIEKEIAGKDENLVAAQKARIANINNQLKTISENAVQKQAAGEVPVQPRTEVSGEMAEGKPQAEPQVTAEEGKKEVDSYIANRFRTLKIEPIVGPLLEKMNNAEYIDDADVDNALEVIFAELDDIDNSEYSDDVKKNVKDSLLNLAENLDNYEFRTKDKTVTVAQKRAADSTRENVQKVKIEEFFSGAKATYNGEEVEFDTADGTVKAKRPNGETVVFDTPSMTVKEDGIVIGEDGNVSTVTMVDRFGSEFTFDGDIALDLAIKDRQNKIGEIPAPVFEVVMEEMTVKEPYIKESKVETTPAQAVETQAAPVAEAIEQQAAPAEETTQKKTAATETGTKVVGEEIVTEEPVTEVDEAKINEEVDKLEDLLKSNDPNFQLDTELTDEQRKESLVSEALSTMSNTDIDDLSEESFEAQFPSPEVKTYTIDVKENSKLASKLKKMGLKDLIGKKINLVMADQLKVGEVMGRKRMGGPFFPLIDELFGKVAWASMNQTAAQSIINGAVKSDYTVVYNMNPSAIDSNVAITETFEDLVQSLPKNKQKLIFSAIQEQVLKNKYTTKTDQVRAIAKSSKTLTEFFTELDKLDVDTISAVVKNIMPSRDVDAGTKIGKLLQDEGITIESIREMNVEQFASELPAGALTMVIEVTDKSGKKVTKETAKEAIITPEQQDAEGLPRHKNYPIYVRGKAVAMLSETVPFWNILKESINNINVKVAGIVREKSGRRLSSREAVSNEMRSASMTASVAKKVSEKMNTQYSRFVSAISQSFPNVEVVTSQEEFDNLLKDLSTKKLSTKNAKVYGAVYKGKLYLNPSLENYNTPIHEFGHIWINTAKLASKQLYDKGISLVKGSEYENKIRSSKAYQRVINQMKADGASNADIDNYIYEEALATAVGDKGESFVTASQKLDFKNWMKKLFSFVKSMTGISKYTSEQLENITLDEFTQAVSVDIMSGTELFKGAESANLSDALQLMTNDSKSIEYIISTAKNNNISDAAIREYLKRKLDINDKEATEAINQYNIKEEDIWVPSKGKLLSRVRSSIQSFRKRYLSARSFLPRSVFAYKEQKEASVASHLNIVDQNVTDFNRLYDKYKGDKEQLRKDFDAYIRGDKTVELPEEFKILANSMRNQIDGLSRQLIDLGLLDKDTKKNAKTKQKIEDNLGKYLTRSYKVYDNANWKNEVEEEVKQRALNFMRTQYKTMAEELAIAENMSFEEALNNLVNNRFDELLDKEGATNFVKGSRLGSKDLSVLKERQDIPFEIRALMGEYQDPALNYARTVMKLSSLAANHKFLTEVKNAGMGKYFFEKNDPRRGREFNTQIATEGSETMNPLNGLYTTKEIAEAFEAQQEELGTLMQNFMKLQSGIRWAKTIGSIGTHFKNVIGNLGFIWINAHYKDMGKAYKVVKNDLFKSNNKERRDLMNNYINLGIVKQSAGLGEIMDMFKDANFDTAMASRLTNQKLGILGKAKRFLLQGKKKIEDAYQAEDDFFKIVAYENELSRYSKAMFGKSKSELTEQELDEVNKVVTEIVKNTYPTYDRIPEAIKMIRRFPFIGNFVSFQAEAYRTAFNTIALAKQEILSKDPKIRKIGATRLAGATSYIAAKTAVLQYVGMAAGTGLTGALGYFFDDDDEEQKDKDIREFVAPWSKESDLLVIDAGNGKLKYIDFSATDPHGGIKKAINAFLLGESTTDSFIDGLIGVIQPFIGEEMTTEAILALKNNRDKYGKEIWNPEDNEFEKIKAISTEVYKLMEPGTISSVRRGAASENKGQELLANVTGFRVYDVDINKQFGFKVKDYSERIKNAKRIYNSAFFKEESTKQEKEQAYKKANNALSKIYKEVISVYNSAERLGVKPDDLKNSMIEFGDMSKADISKLQAGEVPELKSKDENKKKQIINMWY